MTSVLVKLIRRAGGEAGVARVIAGARSTHEPSYLENVENWVSLDEACALLEAGARETDDPSFARRVGENTLRQHAGTQVSTVLRSLGSTEAVLKAVAASGARLSAVTELEAIAAEPGRCVVTARAREGFTRRPLHCEWTAGLLAGTPILFGLPLARVEESECQARGGQPCRYTVTWDAELAAVAADPQQRVTALEAQLVAMNDRLHSAYATAGDLVSVDDLDAVLHRVVERAADAVRAPSHILAVRTDPAADLRVFSHGIEPDRAAAIAEVTLAGSQVAEDSVLAVDVASARRDYGQLIARYPGAVEFFPQDRELLGLYARYAAAVLDMSVALEQSVRRHQQVSSLLSLSHAVAEAGSSLEIAERLVTVVPNVVDCDRVGVWLFDYLEQNLRPVAMSQRTAEQDRYLSELVIATEDTSVLRDMLATPKPCFLDRDTDDAFMRALLEDLGTVRLGIVPIVSRDVFLGVLTVSVSDTAERLRPNGDLIDRLTGVAALAATAIQNGQLVDKLRHKASHDALTGLLNRVGFRQQIDDLLNSGEPGLGLIYVDLDEFKHVNDTYGHDAGDELLRKAAHRLESTARAGDGVARLGGDEFAIVLAGVSAAEQLAAAEARVRAAFEEPFMLGSVTLSVGASIGGGVWLEHGQTIDELSRHADEAMYADKASGRSSPVELEPRGTLSHAR
jgi:diguanylate cyclase (GGDEF)-like protein